MAVLYGKIPNNLKILKDDLIYYENGKKIRLNALSHLRLIKSNELYSYVELKPITGRKHQLRKQMLNIGYPILGDNKYFIVKNKIKNLMLHSYKVKFIINNTKYNFKAEYDNFFENFLKKNF